MKRKRYLVEQFIAAVRQHELGGLGERHDRIGA